MMWIIRVFFFIQVDVCVWIYVDELIKLIKLYKYFELHLIY